MRILIAEDDPASRRMLEAMLVKLGYDVVVASDGDEAWQALDCEDPPSLAILDWMMPGMDGIEVCRKVRHASPSTPIYILLLTIKSSKEDIVSGLEAGADDYLTKPFDHGELHARVQVGARMVRLQRSLAERVRELEEALSQVKQLQGLLPMCSYCKSIRNDQNYWQKVERYITDHSEVQFSHSVCPDCYVKVVQPEIERFIRKRKTT